MILYRMEHTNHVEMPVPCIVKTSPWSIFILFLSTDSLTDPEVWQLHRTGRRQFEVSHIDVIRRSGLYPFRCYDLSRCLRTCLDNCIYVYTIVFSSHSYCLFSIRCMWSLFMRSSHCCAIILWKISLKYSSRLRHRGSRQPGERSTKGRRHECLILVAEWVWGGAHRAVNSSCECKIQAQNDKPRWNPGRILLKLQFDQTPGTNLLLKIVLHYTKKIEVSLC